MKTKKTNILMVLCLCYFLAYSINHLIYTAGRNYQVKNEYEQQKYNSYK